jgi:colanic acid/amylovoran biosynthesis glycosyltransferase
MSEPLTLGYMSNVYARASDTFVRREVLELRALGHTVHTFSIREPDASELVSDAVRDEYERTDYVLSNGPAALASALVRWARRRPRALARAVGLARALGTPGARGRLWPYAYLLEAAYLAERLEALGVQHLHDHIVEGSASVAMLASELSGVPFSVTVHGPREFDHPGSLALGLKMERAAFFVAPALYTRGQLLRWSRPEDWPRIHNVRSGVERALLERARRPLPDAPRFVSIGRLDVDKGQLLLVDAVAQLREAGVSVEVTVIGDGPFRARLERAAARLGVVDRVRFPGWLAFDEVVACIDDARALVMPSLAEGLPNVVTESLALGRPVIATAVAGTGELVETGVTGWLVPAGAVKPLADAIKAAAAAPQEELARLAAAGTERVRERHDGTREAQRLEALFRESVARAGR